MLPLDEWTADGVGASHARVAQLIDTVPAQIWSARADGAVDFLNRRWLDYTGLAPADALGWGWTNVVHPGDRASMFDWSHALRSSGRPAQTLARLRRADGEYCSFLVSGECRHDAAGAITGWCATNTAIDDTAPDDNHQDGVHSLRLIVDSIPGQIVILNDAGVIELVNEQILRYFGTGLAELQGWVTGELVHPEDLPRVVAHWQHAIRTGEPLETEHRLRRVDGVYRWFQLRGRPLRDGAGRILRWYCLITDIHARKMTEEALQRSEAFLLDAQRLSRTGSWRLDLATGQVHSSPEILRAYGLGPDDRYPEPAFWFERIHVEDRERVHENFSRCVSEGAVYEADYRIVRADGTTSYQHSIGHPVFGASGEVVEFIGASMDVTDHTRAREDLQRASETLRATQAKLSLAARMATVSELAASIAHEVNQPLAAVVTNGHACRRWLSASPPNLVRAVEAADRIVKDGKDAGDVIRRVRALFTPADVQHVALNLNEVIREVLDLLQADTRRRGVTCHAFLQPDLAAVEGDRIQLQQLVLNLLLNALDAVHAVDERPRRVAVRSQQHDDDVVVIEIEDNGNGIDDMDKAFEAFYTTKPEGMGMGLSICRSIAAAHHGVLIATRNHDVGMTLRVELPVHAPVR